MKRAEHDDLEKQGYLDLPTVLCEKDGSYAPLQYWSFGQAHCVDKEGNNSPFSPPDCKTPVVTRPTPPPGITRI